MQCNICYEENKPVYSPPTCNCNIKICRECYRTMAQVNKISCPMCRKSSVVVFSISGDEERGAVLEFNNIGMYSSFKIYVLACLLSFVICSISMFTVIMAVKIIVELLKFSIFYNLHVAAISGFTSGLLVSVALFVPMIFVKAYLET